MHTMPFRHTRVASASRFAALIVLLKVAICFPQADAIMYDAREWKEVVDPRACYGQQSAPDTGIYNDIYVYGDIPTFGYPYHYSLIAGVNDTLHAAITLYNLRDKNYDLSGKDYEHWFAPQVYQMYVSSSGGPTFRDSTELGWRVRGWYSSLKRHPTQKALPARASWYNLKLDMWNLPEGHFQICILPTNKVPSDMTGLAGGDVFDFQPAHNLADSCNGYEGCFWRAEEDSDFTSMSKWIDKILQINPTSVPGWWLKAYYSWELRDSAATKDAYDKAIEFLNAAADPAMPDSTKRPLGEHEKKYVEWLQVILPYNRAQLGP